MNIPQGQQCVGLLKYECSDFIFGQMFTPNPVLLSTFSISAHLSTPGPGSERVSEVSQSYLSLLAWIPAYPLHLFPPLKAGNAWTQSCGAVL